MNNKFYVSYEAARLLKEKGFNKETIFYYNCTGKLYLGNGYFNHNVYTITLSAPTKAEAIDWLESKGIVVEVAFDCNMQRWYFSIYKEDKTPWIKHLSNSTFSTRLEADDAAIIKALKLLENGN